MKKSLLAVSGILALLWANSQCFGAGFKVSEQGAKAMAMANAFAARADDPSALYYNPAGIAFLKGTQVNVGAILIMIPQTEFSGTTPLTGTPPFGTGVSPVVEKAKRDMSVTPTVYATYSMERIPLSFGLGINSIYPLTKIWDNSSVFRNEVQSVWIKPLNFQPTVAWRFDAIRLAVAAGLDVNYTQVELQKTVYAPVIDPTNPAPPFGAFEVGALGLDGTAFGFGYNLGIKWQPRDYLSFGLAYRSPIRLDIRGDASFLATTPTGLGAIGLSSASVFPYTRVRATSPASTNVTLPDTLDLAVAVRPTDRLTLEFDATRTGWSSFDKLLFHFDSPQFALFNNQPSPRNWKDVWAYRFGGQYALTQAVDLRAGYSYDLNPAPDATLDPLLPDSDRHSFAVGAGFHRNRASLDLAYMWVHFIDRTVHTQNMTTLSGQNGTFKSDAHLIGANLTVRY